MGREFNYEILTEIKERWSPRAFSQETITDEDIEALIEAARYAPSCFNEQPWRFLVAKDIDSLEKMREGLAPTNQEWANKSPVLIMIASKKHFSGNEKNNSWHMFDTGTAWGYLSLEGQRRGLITHAMGGFSQEKIRSSFQISDELDIITIVAVGKYGDINQLNSELRDREKPGIRKPIQDIMIK